MQHGAPCGESVCGHILWDSFSDVHVAALYRAVFAQVRRGRTCSVTFRFDDRSNCSDMTLTMWPAPDGAIECESSVAIEHSDAFVRHSAASPKLVACCSWCGSLKRLDTWVSPDAAIERDQLLLRRRAPLVSHGVCPTCERQALGDLR